MMIYIFTHRNACNFLIHERKHKCEYSFSWLEFKEHFGMYKPDNFLNPIVYFCIVCI